MANVDEKVMAMVERELEKNPDMGSGDLFEKVKGKHSSIAELSVRQFHARYPLQVKRRKKASSGASSSKKRTPSKKRSAGKSGTRRSAAKKRSTGTSKTRTRTRRTAAPAPRNTREAVRGILMRFATELASAEAKAEVVKVLAGTDRYVDEVIDAAGS